MNENQYENEQVELSPFDEAFNRMIDRAVAWFDKHIAAPFLGAGQPAID